jgi:hypothetical protein
MSRASIVLPIPTSGCCGDVSVQDEEDLERITQCRNLDSLGFEFHLDWLTSIEMPRLWSVDHGLQASVQENLVSIDMPSLTYVSGDLTIRDIDSLRQSDAEAFADSIEVGGTVTVELNGGDCP